MEALVIAGMIAHQLGMKIASVLVGRIGRERLSYERLYDLLAIYLIEVRDFTDLANSNPTHGTHLDASAPRNPR